VFRVGLPPNVLVELVDKLADMEYRLAYGTSEKLQLGSLVAAFMDAREGVVAAAK
jgi:replication factor C subunit 3/5